MIKILVDTLGGDGSPDINIEGGVKALKNNKDLEVVFVGDKAVIEQKLNSLGYNGERAYIEHAPDLISNDDVPTVAIRTKKESSLYRCFELLRFNDDVKGLVTTGSTGALLAGAVLKLGRIPGVKRPAYCPILPTMNGGVVSVCDSGANVDCDSQNLMQFALMGSMYMQKAFGIENPRVALLNVGTEEEKGDALRKEVYPMLKECKELNFVGNMESRDLISGKYDLVVSDGFSGNVLIKSTEGTCLEFLKLLKKTFFKNLKTKLGALFLKKEVKGIKNKMDYNNYGGAVLLGAKKTIVKGHGSSKASAVFHCIEQAYTLEKNNLREDIEKVFKPEQE